MTIHTLADKGQSKSSIARVLEVSEGTVRYHLKRREEAATDGRAEQPMKADAVADVIHEWMKLHGADDPEDPPRRPPNIKELYEFLVAEHSYSGSYKSVLRYCRKHYPKPRRRTYRRIETPPGAQAQVDWLEVRDLDIGAGPQTVYAFVMTLSHSRRTAVVWCTDMRQPTWLRAHNEAFRQLGGVPALVRIDNVKTAVMARRAGKAVIHPAYQRYAEQTGFHVEVCMPRRPEEKGKVERRCGALRQRLNLRRRYHGLAGLQETTERLLADQAQRRTCPATGTTVAEAFAAEQPLLRPCDQLVEVFDKTAIHPVDKSCMVNFECHEYSVPFAYAFQQVEVRGVGDEVHIYKDDTLIATHPRHSPERNVINLDHYEGEATLEVLPPTPLGKVAKRLLELAADDVEYRSVDFYADLAEVVS